MKSNLLKKTTGIIICMAIIYSILTLVELKEVNAAVKITPKKKTLIVGQSLKINIKGNNKKVTWSSSRKKVATVSKKGRVKAIKKGTATIKAKVGSKVLKCKIKVESPVLSKKQIWTLPGETEKVLLKGNSQDVVWESNNESVATVDDGTITTVSEGKATIYARVGKKTYKCSVYVSDSSMKETIKNIQGVVGRTNEIRAEHGLKPLEIEYNLCMAAMERCKDITEKFSHERPDGTSCFTVLKKYGYKVFSFRGENIAYGYTTPEKVMDGWMVSEGHKDRILDSNYEKTGVGYYFDETTETCYWVQIFYTK